MIDFNNLEHQGAPHSSGASLTGLRKSALLSATGLGGKPALAVAMSVILLTAPDVARPALANPQNGQVVSGGATISESGNVLTVNQSSQNVQINWESFSIGAGETTRFVQPNSSSVALNRVLGNDPSAIFGNLTANGQVFLINPNGVVFGAGSRVDVQSLAVTTANIGIDAFNAQLDAGKLSFDEAALNQAASIVNEGDITVAETGFVAMVAPHVRNDGVIVANLGKVELGAAQTFTLDLHGDNLITLDLGSDPSAFDDSVVALLENGGDIHANGGVVALKAASLGTIVKRIINTDGLIEANSIEKQSGKIVLSATGPGTSVLSGTIRANGDDPDEAGGTVSIDTDRTVVTGTIEAKGNGTTGGNIDVTGREVLLVGAAIDASGGDGGRVRVGGEFQGGKNLAVDEIRNADNVLVDKDSKIRVDSNATGSAGDVIIWSEKNTLVQGLVSSMPGLVDADGGLIEISSKGFLDFDGELEIRNGEVLFDPTNITVTSAASSLDLSGNVSGSSPDLFFAFGAGQANSEINASEIQSQLGASNNLTLQATDTITIEQQINSGNSSGALTFQAGNSIVLNAGITHGGNLNLIVNASATASEISNRSLSLSKETATGDIRSTDAGTGREFNISGDVFMVGSRIGDNGTAQETGAWNVQGGTFIRANGDAELTYRGVAANGNNFVGGLNFDVGGNAAFTTAHDVALGSAMNQETGSASAGSLSLVIADENNNNGNVDITQTARLEIGSNFTITHTVVSGGENTNVSLTNSGNNIAGSTTFTTDVENGGTSNGFQTVNYRESGLASVVWNNTTSGRDMTVGNVTITGDSVSSSGTLDTLNIISFIANSGSVSISGNIEQGSSGGGELGDSGPQQTSLALAQNPQQAQPQGLNVTAATGISSTGSLVFSSANFSTSSGNIDHTGSMNARSGSVIFSASAGEIKVTDSLTANGNLQVVATKFDIGRNGSVTLDGSTGLAAWNVVSHTDPGTGTTPADDNVNFLLEGKTKSGVFVPEGGSGQVDLPASVENPPPPVVIDTGLPPEPGTASPARVGGGGNGGPPPPGGKASEQAKQAVADNGALGGGDPLLGGGSDPAGDAAAEVSGQTQSNSQLSDGAAATGDQGVVDTTNGVLGLLGDGGADGGDAGGPPPGGDPGGAFSEPTSLVPGLVEYDPNQQVASTGPSGAGSGNAGGGNPNAGAGGGNAGGGNPNAGAGGGNAGGGNPNAGAGGGNAGGGNPNAGAGSDNAGGANPNADAGSDNAGGGNPNAGAGSDNAGGNNPNAGSDSDNANENANNSDGESDSSSGDGASGDGEGGSGDGDGNSGGGQTASVGVGAGANPGIGGLDGVSEDGRLPAPFSSLGL